MNSRQYQLSIRTQGFRAHLRLLASVVFVSFYILIDASAAFPISYSSAPTNPTDTAVWDLSTVRIQSVTPIYASPSDSETFSYLVEWNTPPFVGVIGFPTLQFDVFAEWESGTPIISHSERLCGPVLISWIDDAHSNSSLQRPVTCEIPNGVFPLDVEVSFRVLTECRNLAEDRGAAGDWVYATGFTDDDILT
jgi:hypothetical protein